MQGEVEVRLKGEVDLESDTEETLSTGDGEVDNFLNLVKNTVTLIFGPAFVGKTTLALSLSLGEVRRGSKVLYLDSEGGVFVSRVKEMSEARGIGKSTLIRCFKLLRLYELKEVLEMLDYALKYEFDLIVVDSLSRPFLKELHAPTSEELRRKYELLSSEVYFEIADFLREGQDRGVSLILISEIKLPARSREGFFYLMPLPFPQLSTIAKNAVGLFMKDGRRFMYLERHAIQPSIYERPTLLEFTITKEGVKYLGLAEISKERIYRQVPIL